MRPRLCKAVARCFSTLLEGPCLGCTQGSRGSQCAGTVLRQYGTRGSTTATCFTHRESPLKFLSKIRQGSEILTVLNVILILPRKSLECPLKGSSSIRKMPARAFRISSKSKEWVQPNLYEDKYQSHPIQVLQSTSAHLLGVASSVRAVADNLPNLWRPAHLFQQMDGVLPFYAVGRIHIQLRSIVSVFCRYITLGARWCG